MGQHFIQQMFSGLCPISLGGQILRRHRATQFDMVMPVAFVNKNQRNQFRPMTNGQTDRAGSHLKGPAFANRQIHPLDRPSINGNQQCIPGGEKLVCFAQLIQIKGVRNFRKRRESVSQPIQVRTIFRLAGDQACCGNSGGTKPKSGQAIGAGMNKREHDRAFVLPGTQHRIESLDAATAHPFGFRQPFRHILQHLIQITLNPRNAYDLARPSGSETGGQRRWIQLSPQRRTHTSVAPKNPEKAPNRQSALHPAKSLEEDQFATVFESVLHLAKADHGANYWATQRGFNIFLPDPVHGHSSRTKTTSPFACAEGKSVV